MDQRSLFKPFWRINKSVMFLGIKTDDLINSLVVFLVMFLFLKDLVIPIILSLFYISCNTLMRRVYRQDALLDWFLNYFHGEVYVIKKNRSFKWNRFF